MKSALKEKLNWKDTCASVFIAALFTMAKTWTQPKCASTDDKEDVAYVYMNISHKKEWNNAICCNIDGPRDYHTKWSKSARERQMSYDITPTWNLRKDTKEFIYKIEINSQT